MRNVSEFGQERQGPQPQHATYQLHAVHLRQRAVCVYNTCSAPILLAVGEVGHGFRENPQKLRALLRGTQARDLVYS